MKVFNCQDMPKHILKMFFHIMDSPNDVYVRWQISENSFPEGEGLETKAIDQWLIDNGAEAPQCEGYAGEEVIISHWW